MPLRAIISDFDGVIADSEPLHLAAFQSVLAEVGLSLTEQRYYESYVGYDDRTCFAAVAASAGRPLAEATIAALCERKAKRFVETMVRDLQGFDGGAEFFRAMARHCPLAICSGAVREEIVVMLRHLQLADCFGPIVSADDVSASKPDPEGYLLAMERLRAELGPPPLQAEACLVIEDTIYGIRAARAAGMAVVAVTHTAPAEQLQEADLIVDGFAALSPARLASLVGSP